MKLSSEELYLMLAAERQTMPEDFKRYRMRMEVSLGVDGELKPEYTILLSERLSQ